MMCPLQPFASIDDSSLLFVKVYTHKNCSQVKRNLFETFNEIKSSLVCPLVCQLDSVSLNISETVHLFFLIICMKLGHHKGKKVTEPDFEKKSFGVTNGGNPPFWGHF